MSTVAPRGFYGQHRREWPCYTCGRESHRTAWCRVWHRHRMYKFVALAAAAATWATMLAATVVAVSH